MKLPKIFDEFAKVSFASYTFRAIGAFIAIILARWLGPVNFGVYSIGFYILTIFGTGFTGIDQSYVYFATKNPQKEYAVLSNYAIIKIVSSLFFISIITLIVILPISFNFSGASGSIILWGLIGGFGIQMLTILLSQYQARKNFGIFSRVKLTYSALLLFLILLGIQFNIDAYIYYLIVYAITGILIVVFSELRFSILEFKFKVAKRFWEYGKWLIMYHLLRMTNLRLDFLCLSKYQSGEVLGQYSVALKLVNMFVILLGTFHILLLPRASSIKSIEDLKKYWKESIKIILFLILSWAIIFTFSSFIIDLLFGPQYINAIPILKILLFSTIPLIFVLPIEYIFFSMEKTIYLFTITVVQSISLLIMLPFLINKMGAIGAAYSKVISFFLTGIAFILIYSLKREIFFKKLKK